MRLARSGCVGSALLLGLGWSTPAFAAMAWKIVYPEQGTSRGFYDSTVVAPVGGNAGRTLGEQRRIALEKAVSIWADVLSSSVPVTIEARMVALPCDEDGAILGQASPASAVAMPAKAGARELAYPIALANALDGTDLEPPSTDNPSGAEIFAEFNSDLGQPSCLDGSAFYLGLDGKAGDETDFLGVVLHELGHGFGFSSFLDYETAAPLFPEAPDSFSIQAFDLQQRNTWDKLTASQLLASFTNARGLVWNGARVKTAVPRYLVKGSPRVTINPPVAGFTGMVSEHDDSPKPADQPVTGPLAVPTPATGCERPSNAARIAGAVVLVNPGDACHPLEAVGMMEVYGAAAVMTVDDTATWPPAMISGILEGQTIPVVTIHPDDAALLAAQAVGRSVVIDGDLSRYVGADAEGRPYLNATDPIVEGTSISHWDPLARNQLLMEPERSAGFLDVDLTREFMWDLGWPICGDGAVDGLEECDDGNRVDTDSCRLDCKKARGTNVGAGGRGSAAEVPSDAPAGGEQVSCSCRLHETRRAGALSAVALILGMGGLARRRRRGIEYRSSPP